MLEVTSQSIEVSWPPAITRHHTCMPWSVMFSCAGNFLPLPYYDHYFLCKHTIEKFVWIVNLVLCVGSTSHVYHPRTWCTPPGPRRHRAYEAWPLRCVLHLATHDELHGRVQPRKNQVILDCCVIVYIPNWDGITVYLLDYWPHLLR